MRRSGKHNNVKEYAKEYVNLNRKGALWEYFFAKTLVKYGNDGREIGNSKNEGNKKKKKMPETRLR